MTGPIVFIVSEDTQIRQSVKGLVESVGLQAATFATLQALLDGQEPEAHGCLVFYSQDNIPGDQTQQAQLTAACAGRPGILILERGNVPMAVFALKAGITDVVQKPYRDKDLLEQILKALEVNTTA